MPPREAFTTSTWHALRALELDDTLAETHALLGMLRKELDYNWPEVERELRRAFELNPRSPLVRLRRAISLLVPLGRVAEALDEVEAMVQTDPLSLFIRWWLGAAAIMARRFDRAVEEGRPHGRAGPGALLRPLGARRRAWTGAGRLRSGGRELERAHELSGGIPFTRGFLACACGRAGRRERAGELLEGAERAAAAGYVPPSTFAFGYAGLGQWDAAFEWLEKAYEVRDPLIMPITSYHFLEPHPRRPALPGSCCAG